MFGVTLRLWALVEMARAVFGDELRRGDADAFLTRELQLLQTAAFGHVAPELFEGVAEDGGAPLDAATLADERLLLDAARRFLRSAAGKPPGRWLGGFLRAASRHLGACADCRTDACDAMRAEAEKVSLVRKSTNGISSAERRRLLELDLPDAVVRRILSRQGLPS